MYGQPKVHKTNYPLRPIVSSIRPYNHELAKYLAEIIKKNRPEKSFSYVKDSFEFVKIITELKQSKDQTMISFDVDNLHSNVLVNEAIDITLDMLFEQSLSAPIPLDRNQMTDLLELTVCNIRFRFLDRTYVTTKLYLSFRPFISSLLLFIYLLFSYRENINHWKENRTEHTCGDKRFNTCIKDTSVCVQDEKNSRGDNKEWIYKATNWWTICINIRTPPAPEETRSWASSFACDVQGDNNHT